jgi:carbonic anhydrase/acetyltransferase-like protein (isoleucine patch superfamily)
MILQSGTKRPKIHSSAYVAPTAIISGDVNVGQGCAILHGAVITSEGAPISIGNDCVIMEHAVIKSSGGEATKHPCKIADACIVGPHAYISGATLQQGVYIGAGAKIYNAVTIEKNGRVLPNEVKLPKGSFFEGVYNLDQEPNVGEKAAKKYSGFLRAQHAKDSVIDAHQNVSPGARQGAKESDSLAAPVEADSMVDAMMLELQEMQQIRDKKGQQKK